MEEFICSHKSALQVYKNPYEIGRRTGIISQSSVRRIAKHDLRLKIGKRLSGLLRFVVSNKLRANVKNEISFICAKFGDDVRPRFLAHAERNVHMQSRRRRSCTKAQYDKMSVSITVHLLHSCCDLLRQAKSINARLSTGFRKCAFDHEYSLRWLSTARCKERFADLYRILLYVRCLHRNVENDPACG